MTCISKMIEQGCTQSTGFTKKNTSAILNRSKRSLKPGCLVCLATKVVRTSLGGRHPTNCVLQEVFMWQALLRNTSQQVVEEDLEKGEFKTRAVKPQEVYL